MNEPEIVALLDAHDALVKAVIAGELGFSEFLAAYDYFPREYALDGHEATPEVLAVLRRSRRRVAFHLRVSSSMLGVCSDADAGNAAYGEAGRFAPAVALMRLRALVARYPDFKAEPEGHGPHG
jgi:hypothetical protein